MKPDGWLICLGAEVDLPIRNANRLLVDCVLSVATRAGAVWDPLPRVQLPEAGVDRGSLDQCRQHHTVQAVRPIRNHAFSYELAPRQSLVALCLHCVLGVRGFVAKGGQWFWRLMALSTPYPPGVHAFAVLLRTSGLDREALATDLDERNAYSG